jgi:hypothetical protein
MGKEIVYCEGCGNSLREKDFEKARASTVDHVHYCSACRPVPVRVGGRSPTPSGTAIPRFDPRNRKPSSSSIPAPPPQARRATGVRPKPRTNGPLVAGLVVAGTGVLLILFAMASGKGRDGERPSESDASVHKGRPAPEADPADEAMRDLERSVPGKDPDAVLALCERARTSVRGMPHEARLNQIETKAREEKSLTDLQTGEKFDAALAQIRSLIRSDTLFVRRPEVLQLVTATEKSAGARGAELERLRADYDKSYQEASRRLADFTRSEAERLAGQNKFAEAVAKCDDYLQSFGSTPAGEAIRKYREELEAKRR